MAFQRVGSLGSLPAGSMLEVDDGEKRIAVCNVGGALHAIDGTCPHQGGQLAYGALHGTTVVCPWHAWEFDCVSGEYAGSSRLKLRKYDVRVEGDDILVDY